MIEIEKVYRQTQNIFDRKYLPFVLNKYLDWAVLGLLARLPTVDIQDRSAFRATSQVVGMELAIIHGVTNITTEAITRYRQLQVRRAIAEENSNASSYWENQTDDRIALMLGLMSEGLINRPGENDIQKNNAN